MLKQLGRRDRQGHAVVDRQMGRLPVPRGGEARPYSAPPPQGIAHLFGDASPFFGTLHAPDPRGAPEESPAIRKPAGSGACAACSGGMAGRLASRSPNMCGDMISTPAE